MNDGKIVVGIDIGSSKVVTVIAKVVDEIVNVLGVSEVRSSGIRKGQIVDIVDAVSVINQSLEGAERMAGYNASHVIASIGGSHIESQNSRGVVAVSNPEGEIIEEDVMRVVEAAKAVSIPSTRDIIHVIPRNFIVDGQEGIKDPVGMTGVRLEVDTHLITAGNTSLRNLEKALSEVGVDVESIVFSGYASSISVLSDTEKELGVVLVDIGSGTTDICVYVDGSIAYSSVLPIGARHITNDIAIGLRISLESAEKIKLHLSKTPKRIIRPQDDSGLLPPRRVDIEKLKDEMDLSGLGLSEELHKISQKTLVDGIIKPRLNEIFTMIGIEIKKSGYGGQTPAGIVITGGGARTVGVSESAKRMLAMPVRIGMPTGIKGIIDEIDDSAFAAVIGLAKYGARQETEESSGSKLSMPGLKNVPFGKILKKIFGIIKSFIP